MVIYRLSADCPDCGAPLTLRRNRRTGEHFLGCSDYPHCDFTEPYMLVLQDLAAARVAPVSSMQHLDRELRRIVGLVHPDKWQSGQQSAAALAQTVTTELLALRDVVRGRVSS